LKPNRNFGCEFEYSTEYNDFKPIVSSIIDRIYGRNKVKARPEWRKSSHNYVKWDIKTDSSTLIEMCTPISNFHDIKKICGVIESLGKNKKIKITNNDSFHIHVDANDIEKEKILILWLKYEKMIFYLFPPHRRNNNQYCMPSSNRRGKKIVANIFKEAMESTLEHHSAISFYFYQKNSKNIKRKCRKTVEFRLGEGTTNPEFVRNWILFLLYFMERCKKVKNPLNDICEQTIKPSHGTLQDMIADLKIKDVRLIEWINKRFNKFFKI